MAQPGPGPAAPDAEPLTVAEEAFIGKKGDRFCPEIQAAMEALPYTRPGRKPKSGFTE